MAKSKEARSGLMSSSETPEKSSPPTHSTVSQALRRFSPSSARTSPTPPSGPRPDHAADGTAEVEFPLPESLTTWKVKAWAMGHGTRVGQGEAEVVTNKDLLVRLQAPRFFVQKDEVVLSANVHNNLKTKKTVQVVLELEGSVLEPLDDAVPDRRDRRRRRAPGRLAGQGRPRRPGGRPHEGADR